MSKWKDWKKYVGIAAVLGPLAYFMPAYYSTRKIEKKAYDKYTGHYKRQQKRIEDSEQKKNYIYQEQEKKAALEQRRTAIDMQRDRIGVGSNYRTSTRNENIRGGQKRETLG